MTKTEASIRLAQLGVELSASKLRKTTIAALEAMIAEREPKIVSKRGVVSIAPKAEAVACREGTRQADLIDCLFGGATMWELSGAMSRNATGGSKGWTESSIKSAFYWDVSKVKGYGVRTEILTPRQAYEAGHEASVESYLGTDQEHVASIPVYFLVLPAGLDRPLEHNRKVQPVTVRKA